MDLGGVQLTSDPTATIHGNHDVDVFYRGPNNHLWTSWWPVVTNSHQITELPSQSRASDDAAAKGDWFASTTPPQIAPTSDGAPEVNKFVEWTQEDFNLAPGQSHDVSLKVTEASLLTAQALAFGSDGPIKLSILKNGTVVAVGELLRLPPDRAESSTSVAIPTLADAVVQVANLTSVPLKVKLLMGRLSDRHRHAHQPM
jgi:hypothetical protein